MAVQRKCGFRSPPKEAKPVNLTKAAVDGFNAFLARRGMSKTSTRVGLAPVPVKSQVKEMTGIRQNGRNRVRAAYEW